MGYIGSEEEKAAALTVAAAVPGVDQVIDELQVVNYGAYKDKC